MIKKNEHARVYLDGVCMNYLEKSGCVADDVGELEDVGSELLLHVTQEKDRIFGGEPADVCHCNRKLVAKISLDA